MLTNGPLVRELEAGARRSASACGTSSRCRRAPPGLMLAFRALEPDGPASCSRASRSRRRRTRSRGTGCGPGSPSATRHVPGRPRRRRGPARRGRRADGHAHLRRAVPPATTSSGVARRRGHPGDLRRRARARRRTTAAAPSAASATPRSSASARRSRSSPARAASSRRTGTTSPSSCASAATTATRATTTPGSSASTRACPSCTPRSRSSRSRSSTSTSRRAGASPTGTARALAAIPGIRVQRVERGRPLDVEGLHHRGRRRRRSASPATRSSTALRADGIDTRNYFDPPVHRQQSHAGVGRAAAAGDGPRRVRGGEPAALPLARAGRRRPGRLGDRRACRPPRQRWLPP